VWIFSTILTQSNTIMKKLSILATIISLLGVACNSDSGPGDGTSMVLGLEAVADMPANAAQIEMMLDGETLMASSVKEDGSFLMILPDKPDARFLGTPREQLEYSDIIPDYDAQITSINCKFMVSDNQYAPIGNAVCGYSNRTTEAELILMYATQDVDISAKEDHTDSWGDFQSSYTINLKLKKGWNYVVYKDEFSYDGTTRYSLSTQDNLGTFQWRYIPKQLPDNESLHVTAASIDNLPQDIIAIGFFGAAQNIYKVDNFNGSGFDYNINIVIPSRELYPASSLGFEANASVSDPKAYISSTYTFIGLDSDNLLSDIVVYGTYRDDGDETIYVLYMYATADVDIAGSTTIFEDPEQDVHMSFALDVKLKKGWNAVCLAQTVKDQGRTINISMVSDYDDSSFTWFCPTGIMMGDAYLKSVQEINALMFKH
jgi:hypothetical protein